LHWVAELHQRRHGVGRRLRLADAGPLAVDGLQLGQRDLPAALERLREPAVPDTVVPTLLTTSFSLCGLRHDEKIIRELYMSLSRVLEDSTTYQWIIKQGLAKGEAAGFAKGEAEGRAEGEAQEARKLLLRLGRKRFGEPSEAQAAALAGITDLDRLEPLADRVIDADVASWDDLLSTP
jgi:predicted transposase YdaD